MKPEEQEYQRQMTRQPWVREKHPKHPDNHIKCMHDACDECHGTGRKKDGSMCIHMLSCSCPRCTPRF